MKNRNLNTSTKTRKTWKTLTTDDSSMLINHTLFTPTKTIPLEEWGKMGQHDYNNKLIGVFLFFNYFAFLRSLVGDYKPFYKRSFEDEDLSEKEKKFDMMRFGKWSRKNETKYEGSDSIMINWMTDWFMRDCWLTVTEFWLTVSVWWRLRTQEKFEPNKQTND